MGCSVHPGQILGMYRTGEGLNAQVRNEKERTILRMQQEESFVIFEWSKARRTRNLGNWMRSGKS